MAAVYDDEQVQRQAQETVDRVNAKFMAWAEKNLIGKPITEISSGQVKATMLGILKAELGLLPGAHQRPVTTPRRRP